MSSVNECDGGVSVGSIGTLDSVQGVGNAVPAQMAAMTAAEQTDPKSFGSGDKWGVLVEKKKRRKRKYFIARKRGKKYTKVHENLSYDEATDKLLEMHDKECKIYLMADGGDE